MYVLPERPASYGLFGTVVVRSCFDLIRVRMTIRNFRPYGGKQHLCDH